jgi:hypothetical protein
MDRAVRFLLLLLVVACAGSPEPVERERLGVGVCGADGHVLAGAAAGDQYTACDAAIQSVVISNGETTGAIAGDCWTLTVTRMISPTLPLVIQFRDVDHRTLCPSLAGP